MQQLLETQLSFPLAVLLALPWLYVGFRNDFWSAGIVLGLAWLAISSSLIRLSRNVVREMFERLGGLVRGDKAHVEQLLTLTFQLLPSNKFLFFSVPLVFGIFLLTGFSNTFPNSYLATLAGVTLGVVFLFAGKGFWGVCVAMLILYKVNRLALRIDPFHEDGKGGFSFLDNFVERVGWHFFSGGLLLPMAYQLGQGALDYWTKFLVSVFLLVFFATGILGLALGRLLVFSAFKQSRRTALRESASRMRDLLSRSASTEEMLKEIIFHTSLEKIGQQKSGTYKQLAPFLQPIIGALPISSMKYGKEIQELLKNLVQAILGD